MMRLIKLRLISLSTQKGKKTNRRFRELPSLLIARFCFLHPDSSHKEGSGSLNFPPAKARSNTLAIFNVNSSFPFRVYPKSNFFQESLLTLLYLHLALARSQVRFFITYRTRLGGVIFSAISMYNV